MDLSRSDENVSDRQFAFGIEKQRIVDALEELAGQIRCGVVFPQRSQQRTDNSQDDFELKTLSIVYADPRPKPEFVAAPINTSEMPQVAAMRYIAELTAGEGAGIQILCENPEAWSKSESRAIEITDDWTGWRPHRFYGESIIQCLAIAMEARSEARELDR